MNFVSIICAINLYLSVALPIDKLPAKISKSKCSGVGQDCKVIEIPVARNNNSTLPNRNILLQFQKNPTAFVTEMSKADPDTLRQVLVLLHSLLDTSKTRKDELVGILNDKIAELGTASDDVVNAEGVVETAQAALAAAQGSLSSAESDLAQKKEVRETKQTEKNDAQTNHDAEIDALNNEQSMIQEVIQILEDLLGRQPANGELLVSNGGYSYYKVQVTGIMSSANIASSCLTNGYRALCSGPDGCGYNDDQCVVAPGGDSCSNPMNGVAQLLCNARPNACDGLNEVYNYMHGWAGDHGCGVESGRWCSSGNEFSDKFAMCVRQD